MSIDDDERTRIAPPDPSPQECLRRRDPVSGPGDQPSYGRYTHAFIIGRGENCAIRLLAPGVSRHHVEIFPQDGAWWARDLESSNGTLVNGRPIDRLPLVGTITLELGQQGPRTELRPHRRLPRPRTRTPPPVLGGRIPALSGCRVRDAGGRAYAADPQGLQGRQATPIADLSRTHPSPLSPRSRSTSRSGSHPAAWRTQSGACGKTTTPRRSALPSQARNCRLSSCMSPCWRPTSSPARSVQ